jgi:hypothetical protein
LPKKNWWSTTFVKTESKNMIGRLRRYSLRTLIILVLIAAFVSAWATARLRKIQSERRIAAMCVQLGASVSLTSGDRGWITGLHFTNASNLNDEHLRELAQLKELQILSLNQTKVTGDGLGVLAQFPALRELHVNESRLTVEGIRHLQELDQLEKIGFWGISPDDPRAKQILEALPNIKPD